MQGLISNVHANNTMVVFVPLVGIVLPPPSAEQRPQTADRWTSVNIDVTQPFTYGHTVHMVVVLEWMGAFNIK